MPTLHYRIVDVFTDRAYAGNPLAVVLDADDLSTAEMQAVAAEFNLSESAFPVEVGVRSDAAYRLRIFTPVAELPFAGHPSVGTAWVLRRLGRIPDGPVRQACGAGVVEVDVGGDEVSLTGVPPRVQPVRDPRGILLGAALDPRTPTLVPAAVAGAGLDFAYAVVEDVATLEAARPDLAALAALPDVGGVSLSAWDGATRTARTRVFCADLGVPEDPATGSAALGFGAYAVAAGLLPPDGVHAYTVLQGAEIGRPSTLRCSVTARAGVPVTCTVAGGVVPVMTGELRRPEVR